MRVSTGVVAAESMARISSGVTIGNMSVSVATVTDGVPSSSLGVGLGAFGFHDVWVTCAESGAPSLAFAGAAVELAAAAGVTRWHLSLTHGDLVAIAYVVAE